MTGTQNDLSPMWPTSFTTTLEEEATPAAATAVGTSLRCLQQELDREATMPEVIQAPLQCIEIKNNLEVVPEEEEDDGSLSTISSNGNKHVKIRFRECLDLNDEEWHEVQDGNIEGEEEDKEDRNQEDDRGTCWQMRLQLP